MLVIRMSDIHDRCLPILMVENASYVASSQGIAESRYAPVGVGCLSNGHGRWGGMVAGRNLRKEVHLLRNKLSLTTQNRRVRHLAVAAISAGAILVGSAATATPALAASQCPKSFDLTGHLGTLYARVSGCSIAWYNRSAGLSATAELAGDGLNGGFELCLQGYTGTSGQTKVWQECGSIFYDSYFAIENSGDTDLITRVRFEVLSGGTNDASISFYRRGY